MSDKNMEKMTLKEFGRDYLNRIPCSAVAKHISKDLVIKVGKSRFGGDDYYFVVPRNTRRRTLEKALQMLARRRAIVF